MGAAVAVLSYIFGEHWILFALFLAFNIADWITGWMKARLTHKENSKAGWKGVLKKLGYWIMIAVAFGASAVFVEIGKNTWNRSWNYCFTGLLCPGIPC